MGFERRPLGQPGPKLPHPPSRPRHADGPDRLDRIFGVTQTATTDFNSARRTRAATLRGPLSICRIRRGASEFERKLIFKEVIVAVIADEAAHPTTTRRDRSSRCRSIADRVGVSDDGSDILRKAPAVDGEAPASCNSRRRVLRSECTTTASASCGSRRNTGPAASKAPQAAPSCRKASDKGRGNSARTPPVA